MAIDKKDKQTVDMFDEINQVKVDGMKRMHDAYMEAVSNGSIRYRTTHITPDGTKWDLVLEPQDKSPLGHWSYLGIASRSDEPFFYKHFKFDTDRVYWDRMTPEDMFHYMKCELDREDYCK